MIWEDELEIDSASEDKRGDGWSSRALGPREAAEAPKNMADVYTARGRPIIYEYGNHDNTVDGKFCEAAFTYLKRVSLCTTPEGHPMNIESVVKALHTLDKAHFKRLTETLNVFRGIQ
eukprot:129762-Amphidinium_carterae.1